MVGGEDAGESIDESSAATQITPGRQGAAD